MYVSGAPAGSMAGQPLGPQFVTVSGRVSQRPGKAVLGSPAPVTLAPAASGSSALSGVPTGVRPASGGRERYSYQWNRGVRRTS